MSTMEPTTPGMMACPTCKGSGMKPGAPAEACPQCKGNQRVATNGGN